jgi:hypothetical protein
MSDFEAILKAYEKSGGNREFLKSPKIASLVISGKQGPGGQPHPGTIGDGGVAPRTACKFT